MDKWDASDKSNGMREWDLESSFSSWRRLEKAQHWNEVGRSELAVREMQEALRDDPNNPDLHAYLGWSLSWTEDPAGAEREATAALALDPESSSARALLGCLHTGAGRFVEAEEHLLAALHSDPEDLLALEMYAHLMHRTGHLEKAEALVRRALSLAPDSSRLHSQLALILTSGGRRREAQDAGDLGRELAPDEEFSHLVMGVAEYTGGRPFRARRSLREALRLNPGDPETEEWFRRAHAATRPFYLPMYYWSLWIERIPGQNITVWIGFAVGMQLLRLLGVPPPVLVGVVGVYVLFALYTWVADPIINWWMKLRPPG